MTSTNPRDTGPRPDGWPFGPGSTKPRLRKALNIAATRVLIGAALSLILAGILLFVGGVAPVPGEPRSYPMRPATEAEQQQHDRDQLLDLLRAQQTANQEASR